MNGTGTHEWTIVHNANHRSYVEDELFKKYHFNPPPARLAIPKNIANKSG